jgi:aspartyl protease family protein
LRWIGFLIIISVTATFQVEAKTVAAIALFNDRAMLSVDGKKAKIIRAGSTYKGVKVISSNTSEAVIEVDGKRETLRLNGTAVLGANFGLSAKKSTTSIVLYQNDIGFFESNGEVNGRSTRFLVDTGANLVVFNSHQAKRLGIDYLGGERGYATTASGLASMYLINIELVSVGGIVLKDIGAGVIEGGFPHVPLLGMTFLSRLNMNRSGQTMVLKTR